MSRKYLINVYNSTCQLASRLKKLEPPELIEIDDLESVPRLVKKTGHKMVMTIEAVDTLEMAVKLCDKGFKPLVLNMASGWQPGGGVARGCTAQEEVIFRCTDAVTVHPEEWYPLEGKIIYSQSVRILKDSRYNQLKRYRVASMVSVPAVRKPKLVKNRLQTKDRHEMKKKIDAIFRVAVKYGHRSIVLGALGCGAYGNPATEIADLFGEALDRYHPHFDLVVFAILPIGKSGPENLRVFRERLQPHNPNPPPLLAPVEEQNCE